MTRIRAVLDALGLRRPGQTPAEAAKARLLGGRRRPSERPGSPDAAPETPGEAADGFVREMRAAARQALARHPSLEARSASVTLRDEEGRACLKVKLRR